MAQAWNADGNYWFDDGQFDAAGVPVKNSLDTWLGTVSGNAPTQTKVRDYLGGLQTNYGLTTDDFTNALKSYGATYSDGGFLNDKNVGWWGEDAMLRAFGTGLDTLNPNAAYKGSWQSMWNQGAENAQQKDFADRFAANEANQGSDFSDLGDIMKGVGLVAGVGGLAGAFGELGGITGGGGADLAAAFGDTGLGYGAGSASMGGAAGAAASGSGALMDTITTGLEGLGNTGSNVLTDTITTGLEGAGNAATNTGANNMDWTDFFTNDPGADASSFGDAWNGGMNTGGSDWATNGFNADGSINTSVMNAGSNAASSIGSLLSQAKNIPASVIKSLFGTDDATSASIASLIGKGVGGLLDYNASSSQADALKAIADRSWNAGQPYRDRANAAMTPGFDIKSIPGLSSAMDTATETYLRKLSATNGNPTGIGAAPSQTEAFVLGNVALPAWQNYFNANSNAGGLSNLSAQSNATATQAAGADAAQYGSLAQTARNIFDPQPDNSRYLNLLAKQFGLV